ncbi:hypothetical protein Tco_1482344 [Tanacetum coccineum]
MPSASWIANLDDVQTSEITWNGMSNVFYGKDISYWILARLELLKMSSPSYVAGTTNGAILKTSYDVSLKDISSASRIAMAIEVKSKNGGTKIEENVKEEALEKKITIMLCDVLCHVSPTRLLFQRFKYEYVSDALECREYFCAPLRIRADAIGISVVPESDAPRCYNQRDRNQILRGVVMCDVRTKEIQGMGRVEIIQISEVYITPPKTSSLNVLELFSPLIVIELTACSDYSDTPEYADE